MKRILVVVVFLIGCSCFATDFDKGAVLQGNPARPGEENHAFSNRQQSKTADFNVYKFKNGQTVVIKEIRNNPIVTVDTWIKTGSINETDQNNGVSHFLEHLFFKGSEHYPAGEFDRILDSKGAVTNAATSKDFTHYYITIPSKDFDLAVKLHADMLLHPAIPPAELEKERKVVIEEICKDENSPQTKAYENLVEMIYQVHPYKRKVIGTADIINNISRDEILSYYKEFYNPANMVTVIVGDIDSAKALKTVEENFTCPCQKPIKRVYPQDKPQTAPQRMVVNIPAESGYLLIGYRGTKVDHKDSYALDLLATILGSGRSSIFYKNIKDQKQLANSVYAANSGGKDGGVFYVGANYSPEKGEKLEKALFEEIEKIQKYGVTEEQLKLAKNKIEHDTYYERESISNIAEEIGYTIVTTGDTKYYENYILNMKKVTPQEIKTVANEYLALKKASVSIALPENCKEVQISHTTNSPEPVGIISQNYGTEKLTLTNGATVLMTPSKVNNIIAISIYSKGGEFAQKTPGTANLTASVMMKGTKKYSANELADIMEDSGIKFAPGLRAEMFTLTVLTTKDEFRKTMEILNEIMNNATFSETEIEKSKVEKLNTIKESRDTPFNIAVDGYKTLIFEGTPYSNSPSVLEKTLPKVTRAEILDYYSKLFTPENLIISVNGDVNPNETTDILQHILKDKKGVKFDYSKFSIPSMTTPKTFTKQIKDLKTDWIIFGWQAANINDKDYAALEIIDSILGTGMSSRLYKNLRIKEGLAYQLGSQYAANILKGAFITYIGTNPENLEKAKRMMLAEVNKMKTEPVNAKELQDAKDKIIGNYILSQETNLDKADNVGWLEASGRGYEFSRGYIDAINSVTAKDIMTAANKYFTGNYVLSVVKP